MDEKTEAVEEMRNGDLRVVDALGRAATLHWSRFHGLIISTDVAGAVYIGQPRVTEWLSARLTPEPKYTVAEWVAKAMYEDTGGNFDNADQRTRGIWLHNAEVAIAKYEEIR